jgi:hypothetical protein
LYPSYVDMYNDNKSYTEKIIITINKAKIIDDLFVFILVSFHSLINNYQIME